MGVHAVSNAEFYDNRLIIFPGPNRGKANTGLVYHHLPDTVYDRGKNRTHRLEALALARAVMEQARTLPELALGVAAFSVSRRDAITDQPEMLRQENLPNRLD